MNSIHFVQIQVIQNGDSDPKVFGLSNKGNIHFASVDLNGNVLPGGWKAVAMPKPPKGFFDMDEKK